MISLFILLPLYIVGIQYKRGGLWWAVVPFTGAAFVLDVVLNYTELALLTWDFPRTGERTFSRRLPRLCLKEGRAGKCCILIAKVLDYFDPSGVHVKRGTNA